MTKKAGSRLPGFIVPGLICLLLALAVHTPPVIAQSTGDRATGNKAPTARVAVIEITVESTDTIPIQRLHQAAARPEYPVLVTGDKVLLHPDAARSFKLRKANRRFFFDEGLDSLGDVRVVLIEHDRFAGQMRRGSIRRVLLAKSLPEFPKTFEPDKVYVGPLADTTALTDVIVWPDAEWQADAIKSLNIKGDGGRKSLKAGESHTFKKDSIDAPLIFLRLKPSKVDSDEKPEVEEIDAGRVTFESRVTVTFLGERTLEAPQ